MDLKIVVGKESGRVTLKLNEMSDELTDFISERDGFIASSNIRFETGGATMLRSLGEIVVLYADDTTSDFADFPDKTDRDAYFHRLIAAFGELRDAFNNQSTVIEF